MTLENIDDETAEHIKTHFKHRVLDAATSTMDIEIELRDKGTGGVWVDAVIKSTNTLDASMVNYEFVGEAFELAATSDGALVLKFEISHKELENFQVDYL